MSTPAQSGLGAIQFPCEKCGAQLEFAPGTSELRCTHCGAEQQIIANTRTVVELPLDQYFAQARLDFEQEKDLVLHCNSCSAEFTVPAGQENMPCPFCGSNVIVPTANESRIKPNSVLPFGITSTQARDALGKWIGSRFWAPSNLKALALKEGQLKGMYLPFWTFDSKTTTNYTGMRGEHYYETESYTTTENGQTATRQRTVQKTRWWPASGTVFVPFDDVLVMATRTLPTDHAQRLQTWDLPDLVSYDPKFLAGFQTMRYDVDLEHGFATAKDMMQPRIDQTICGDIGGDEQRILSKTVHYEDNTFKHPLLPVWVGGYRYRSKPYRFVVNGRTGEVQGEAPISFWKVFFAVVLALIVIGTIIYFVNKNKQSQDPSGNSDSGVSTSINFPDQTSP